MTSDTYNLDAEKDDLRAIELLGKYQKILQRTVSKTEIVEQIKGFIDDDPIISFTTKNAANHININRPIFKLKVPHASIPNSTRDMISDKKDYIYKTVITKTTQYLADMAIGDNDIQAIITELKKIFKDRTVLNLVSKSVFTILIDRESDKCYLEYLN